MLAAAGTSTKADRLKLDAQSGDENRRGLKAGGGVGEGGGDRYDEVGGSIWSFILNDLPSMTTVSAP